VHCSVNGLRALAGPFTPPVQMANPTAPSAGIPERGNVENSTSYNRIPESSGIRPLGGSF
jgi:hypothetical protein